MIRPIDEIYTDGILLYGDDPVYRVAENNGGELIEPAQVNQTSGGNYTLTPPFDTPPFNPNATMNPVTMPTPVKPTKPLLVQMQKRVDARNKAIAEANKTANPDNTGFHISTGWLLAGAAILGLILLSDDK